MSTMIAIDIGSKNLHLAEGGLDKKGQLILKKTGSFALPEDCILEESVRDGDRLAEALNNAWKAGNFQSRDAVITINATDHAIIKEVDLPKANPKDLGGMIENEMYQFFNVLKSDIIQYKALGPVTGNEGESLIRYRVAAVNRDLVESYYRTLERAKLRPVAMDLNINAVDKLVSWAESINENLIRSEAVMLLNFGYSITTVYIATREQPMFYRHISMGARDLDSILMNSLGVLREEIPKMKEEQDLFAAIKNDDDSGVYYSLKSYFYQLSDEVRKVVTFFNSRPRNAGIEHVYLFGQGSGLLGMAKFWTENLGISAEPIESVQSGSSGRIPLDPSQVNAVGALLRY